MTTFHIMLGEADRQRLGAPEPLVYDPGTFLLSEATSLFKAGGLTRKAMNDALKAGDPEGKKAITWLALRRAGVNVRYSELDFDLVGWVLVDPNPAPEPDADDEAADDEGNSGAPSTGGQTPQP